jgi:hypothetical protein
MCRRALYRSIWCRRTYVAAAGAKPLPYADGRALQALFDIDEMYDLERDPEEMHNAIADASYAKYTDDMRARLYEMMGQFEDPYGTPAKWTLPGQRPGRYGAPHYLPRGARLKT